MSYWNYRVMRHRENGEEYLEMHEVYYNSKDQITKWTVNAVSPFAKNKSTMAATLDMMKLATKKPILDYDMQPEGEDDQPED